MRAPDREAALVAATPPEAVDWDAVDAMFRYVESPRCPDRSVNGFVVAGFVTAAVMLGVGNADAWWRVLFARSVHPRFPSPEVRRGFLENWRAVEAEIAGLRFRPTVAGPDEPDHRATVAGFCAGFLRALAERPEVLARLRSSGAADAVAALRRYAAARRASLTSEASATPLVAAALAAIAEALAGRRTDDAAQMRAA